MKVPKPIKLGSGSWYIQLRLGGESISITCKTAKECTRKAQMVKAEYLAGNRVAAPKKLPTLSKAIDTYIALKTNVLSPSTIRGYRIIQRNRFKDLMDRSLSDITEDEWIMACNNEAAMIAPKTLVNSWRFIGSVVRTVARMELPRVTLPQVVPREVPFLDPDQVRTFIDATTTVSIQHRIAALLALQGLRRSEIFGLKWEHVDLDKRRILVKGAMVPNEHHKFVYKESNKNRSSTRYVPIMIDELYDALAAEKQDTGFVVTSYPSGLADVINKICDKAGLPHVNVHGLRHTFASLAYHLQVPEKVTMELGGWSDNQTMRKIYTHIAKSDMQRYETQISDFFSKC